MSDEEWLFAAPYLCLLPEDCGQRVYPLREVLNALRYAVWAGCPWRGLPRDLPPWEMIYQQSQRWIKAGVFEVLCHDLRVMVRLIQGRNPQPSAAIFDGRTVQSTPESGGRAGYDGYKKKNGSKTHGVVDTLGHLLALHVTPANEQERDQVGTLAAAVQAATGENVQLAWVDQSYTGEEPLQAAAEHGIQLEVIKLAEARQGFVLLPRRWVVERTFGWIARCRRLARDYERLPTTFAGLHWIMFSGLLLARLDLESFVSS